MQHFHVFGVGVVVGKAVVEIAMQLNHINPQLAQNFWGKCARRAIAAGDNRF